MASNPRLETNEAQIFWGEIAPCEHIAQFYTDDTVLLDTLAGFVGGGLNAGESTIVIATPQHLKALEQRLINASIDLASMFIEDRYIALDANATLASFMAGNWPDDQLFSDFVERLIHRASVKNRRVRAFGEMVALLWGRGHAAATVRLEHLWQQFCLSHSFSLFCAYPRAGFTKDPCQSLADICAAHTRVM
jgi:MEDS: MEthanogen/methylotroph, DcmR Sensory domain